MGLSLSIISQKFKIRIYQLLRFILNLKKNIKIYNNIKKAEKNDCNYRSICDKILRCIEKNETFSLTLETPNVQVSEAPKKGIFKKKVTNPRVIKRNKLKKKSSKWQTVVPKQRNVELGYTGETFGIRKNASRSTKLG